MKRSLNVEIEFVARRLWIENAKARASELHEAALRIEDHNDPLRIALIDMSYEIQNQVELTEAGF